MRREGPSGLHGWPVVLHLSDLDEQLEKEPNNDRQAGQPHHRARRRHRPLRAEGRRRPLRLHGQEGQALHHRGAHDRAPVADRGVHGAEERQGRAGAGDEPDVPAPRLDFTAPADGDYTLVVEHLHSWGGPDEVYRLTRDARIEPDFALTLNIDRWDVAPGGTVSIPIFVHARGLQRPDRGERGRREGADRAR